MTSANKQRLQTYLDAEKAILEGGQTVQTGEGESLTLASLATVRKEIERLQRLVALEERPRRIIRRNYLE
ncbi:hypothetical protein BZJ19_10070 [Salinivibrio proteolyticus]|uniref:hypothetical protein n=1 Tax=Salinivibrio TaxID=51366 RepID=UPI0009899DE0|nr:MULTISPECIES: hypothetical protein [Salinivibrio]MPX98269.1 hypothetical protein [Salinivibrio sp. VYel6]OOF25057.1 hypothetical protein BZJ19_10070 [Salinivibrio proteolyticus]